MGACGAVTIGAQTVSPPPPPSHLVHIDVFATDARGRAVEDLKSSDFELREEGSLQPLERAQFVRAAGSAAAPIVVRTTADERDAAVRPDTRLFGIFLDQYHVSSGASTDRARQALARFIDRDVGPRDLVVVMKPLDSVFAIRLTADREAAREAIRGFTGRRADYEPRNAYEQNYIAGTPARIEAARAQVAWSAINALAVHMGGLADGRKTLIVVSEAIEAAERRRGQEYLATRDTAIRSANRSNVAIYTVDPREAAAPAGDDTLRPLAAETDGGNIAGDLDAGLHRAAVDSSGYYFLTYRSARPDDGKFHDVQVRATRPGVRLRARKGFVAASPDEMLRVALLAHANDAKPAAPPEPPPHVSPLVRPWFGLSRGPDGRSRVTFVWEPASRVPGERGAYPAAVRLVLTARAADGAVLFDGLVAATGPAAIDAPGATPARAVFDAPPGRLRLRMSIQDATSRVLDVDVRDLSIRQMKADTSIGTPEVLRARNAREFRSLEAASAVPVAAREFSRTERLLIRFPAYGPDGTLPSVSAKLLSRLGQTMRDLPVAPAAGPDRENAIDLPLAGLAAGEYIIEVAATTAAGDARDRINFRVTP